jgi:L,D-transpeptidase catalytic domain
MPVEPAEGAQRISPAEPFSARAILTAGAALAVLACACAAADAARMQNYRAKAVFAGEKHRPEPAAPKGPLQIIISIADQTISVYSGDMLVARSAVSTGVPGHPTPMGVFTVIQKQRWHRSNLYSAAPMPYMQRITWSGVALHAGVLPGHPASHGCIRLTEDFAVRLWGLTKLGNRVIIARNEVAPVEISHPALFAQKSPLRPIALDIPLEALRTAQAVVPASDEFIKPVRAVGMAADTGAQPEAAAAQPLPGTQTGAKIDSKADPKTDPKPVAKPEPISVFISRKQGKLLVRQGFTPLFESPVTIRDADRPLGTHVFTAIEAKDSGVRWTVVSFPEQSSSRIDAVRAEPTKRHGRERDAKRSKPSAQPPSPARASAALDRLEIPQEAADRIAELLSPKSSLIISDQALSDETDSDTDFIVLVR